MSESKTRRISAAQFDDEGVHLAILAALHALYTSFPDVTLPQYLIALEVRRAEREGIPHTLASLVKKLKMPFSTVSRVVWSLTEEGGDIGVVRYLSHPTDRRKKQLGMTTSSELAEVSAAIGEAVARYYGSSLRQLRHGR